MQRSIFITIEGIEGVGKSTAVKYIQEYLKTSKIDFIITREPGGTKLAEEIRKMILNPIHDEKITEETELLLMFAARSQHVANVILPALSRGKWVVSDRFIDATYAYQGGGREIAISKIEILEKLITHEIKPDVTILLDTTPEIGLARTKNRGAHDRIEQEKMDFFERVRRAYLKRAQQDPKRFHLIDAALPLNIVQAELKKVIDNLNYG